MLFGDLGGHGFALLIEDVGKNTPVENDGGSSDRFGRASLGDFTE